MTEKQRREKRHTHTHLAQEKKDKRHHHHASFCFIHSSLPTWTTAYIPSLLQNISYKKPLLTSWRFMLECVVCGQFAPTAFAYSNEEHISFFLPLILYFTPQQGQRGLISFFPPSPTAHIQKSTPLETLPWHILCTRTIQTPC